jgi:hypothetical protein
VRTGGTFTSYRSADGAAWTKVSSKSITMGTNVYVGLAVTSKKNGTLSPSTFDHVTAVP